MGLLFDLTFNIFGSIVCGWLIVLSIIKIQEGLSGAKFEKHQKKYLYKRGILLSIAIGLVFYFTGW
ncbi:MULTISPECIES: hypothetical protein [Bacillaceae]|uniref:Uncharacterized protein n=1 Tax=Gottfriedia luciferensis TaxID=178774 RepID=A0ABX2ZMU2_9BACI|nr:MULTISPECIES: hypothetical protein [Bacillaceae]ODG91036.1 hypothetical protein BED47_08385 [Gottfriedia luciferensis]PGZ84709.1 hypothetical protein COE53_23600 [Bacillus sp. AFS029533]SFC82367.1 hypothetical protein SAMN02799633_01825 [Bacillus sp. UNCCL81]